MVTTICMAILLLFLGFAVLYTDSKGRMSSFFDIDTTGCMRGLWSVVILLVHTPADYQNTIQDIIGSFAYIGVTFFFMTSGYGLMLGAQRNSQSVTRGFWKRRLPKLLVPMLIVNVLRTLAVLFADNEFNPLELVSITGFVRQILFFYLVFWAVFKFLPNKMPIDIKCSIICGVIVVFSIFIYLLGENSLFGWPVESLGFMYGILLAVNKDRFIRLAKNRWLLKCFFTCCISLAFGVAYLMFKNVAFIGDYAAKIILGFAITLFILLLNTKLKFGNSVSRFLGNISYEFYLSHDVVFIVLAAVGGKMNSGIFVVSSVLITVIISFTVNKLSKTILNFGKLKKQTG